MHQIKTYNKPLISFEEGLGDCMPFIRPRSVHPTQDRDSNAISVRFMTFRKLSNFFSIWADSVISLFFDISVWMLHLVKNIRQINVHLGGEFGQRIETLGNVRFFAVDIESNSIADFAGSLLGVFIKYTIGI